MKNYEKYADEIRGYKGFKFCGDFILPYILKQNGCGGIDCDQCKMLQMLWLLKDYEEPEVDWSKVAVDTPILVKNVENTVWVRRHFAKYEDGVVYAWGGGNTSWTEAFMTGWDYGKLAETEGEE